METTEPTVYVIAGPNGSGKTTFCTAFLPKFVKCNEFLNADLIAAGLAPFAPETQNIRAGRLLLERIEELTRQRRNFALETTLSGRTYARLFQRMRAEGYRIHIFFLWLPNVELALTRVANRVRQGGHHIAETDIRRRYLAGQKNLLNWYRFSVDAWWLYDAARLPPSLIAGEDGGGLVVWQPTKFERIEHENSERPNV